MNCTEVKKRLPLYMDHMLESHQMDQIDDHLNVCDDCKREHEEMIQMLSLLSTIEDVPLPEGFDLKLRMELKKEAEEIRKGRPASHKKTKWSGWRRFTSIAAVFVVGLFSVFLYNNVDGFNLENLGDSYHAVNLSDQASKSTSEDVKALKKAEVMSEDADTDVKYDINAALKNSMVRSSAEDSGINSKQESSENAASDQPFVDDSQMTLKSAALTENAASQSTGSAAEVVPDDSQTRKNYALAENFNPSRFLETLSQEDAQIYKRLLNANIFLSSGRDSNAVIYYIKQMNKVLGDCDYKLVSCYQEPEGLWNIEISITTTDENGNEVKEDVTYCGKDGELWKKELSLSTETV
ncbi:anti-sigma factor family protein [Clostridium aminobutyricum]|uniref:Zf-HC2 domain-containing protein n=1 Tax=Clostridium aminobutyricum TaxID=33953 RepID=A0A939D6P1_CLOAM|nr:zf-HC2 domain-containing protein [Clostridium aminobutyricum]MBN7772429.1 zf-HC2 domain-containing protein [Clostridium aminobutyricum]